MNVYDIGDQVRVSVVFTDEYGVEHDPTSLLCQIKNADGVETYYTYGESPALTRENTGTFYVDVLATKAGTWHYRWQGSGAITAAAENSFMVRRSKFLSEYPG